MREIVIFPRLVQMAKHCSRAAVGILPFGRISVRMLLVVSVIGALGAILVTNTLDTPTSNDLLKDQDRAIWLARTYANQIVDSDIEALRDKALTGSLAAKALVSSPPPDWRGIAANLYETKYGPPGHPLMDPIRANFSPQDSRMQLLRLRRQGDFLVLSFAALASTYWSNYISINDRPLIVSVAIRYFNPVPDDRFARWLRRLTNVSFLPTFIRAHASGDWYLIDYEYSFNLREYYDWVQEHEQRLYAERAEQLRQDKARSRTEIEEGFHELLDRGKRGVDASYQWAEDECEAQLNELVKQSDVR